ncbi:glycosyltransferase family 4 protein [Luteimicrobium subarcticum]|uniref:D-inositol 3-phosphate glycosyltransferase n=1 Tax=Luteimicrobium subarcticum TaxID=620910 RepID=A0A2M8WTA1_9MICO|nr:glycosyltransferase family 4 protein [Luteimicrobium subarcticum]PJI94124.1 glycosyltransferase involved in cell wall biosynthesis [Luteimicrobium subarcticum]
MSRSRVDVALVTSSFLPHFGGVEEHVLNTARALRARGVGVVVWTVDRGDAGAPSEVDGIAVRVLPCPLPARNARSVWDFARRVPGAAAAWIVALLRDRPRVLHVQCFGPNGVWASALARLVRRPLVVSAHGETFMDADHVYERSRLLPRALRSALARASAITACSAYVARDLERFGGDPAGVVVVPNGIDLDEPPGPPPAWLPERYVLAVGRVVHTKGFDLLVRAVASLDRVHLVVGGDGPERGRLEALSDELGMADRVTFPGRLARPEIVAAMAGADCLVVPSRVEAFGIVVLEGWRAGVPVVATSHGGPPEFVDDGRTGYLVDPEDVVALSRAIDEVVRDPARAQEVAEAGRRRVEGFTWAAVAGRYEELYDSISGSREGT